LLAILFKNKKNLRQNILLNFLFFAFWRNFADKKNAGASESWCPFCGEYQTFFTESVFKSKVKFVGEFEWSLGSDGKLLMSRIL
jgi:hypothetical protein